jgi:hypothetical protein
MNFWDVSRFSVHGDIQAVFDIELPEGFLEDEENPEGAGQRRQSNGIGRVLFDELHNQFGTSLGPRNDGAALSSRQLALKPKKPKRRRRESLLAEPQSRSPSRSRSADAKLRKEFADSDSQDEENDEREKAPKGHRKLKKGERMDSLMDLTEMSPMALQEANARLHKMEDSLKRLEDLVLQLVGGASTDSESVENGLLHAAAAHTLG